MGDQFVRWSPQVDWKEHATMANTIELSACAAAEAEGPRVSDHSGIHIAPAAIARRIEDALTRSSRTDGALADLLRTAQFLCATINAVCQTNRELACELRALRELVVGERAEIIDICGEAFEERETSRSGEGLARQELIAEHDQFIAMLVADHQREVDALRQKLTETRAAVPDTTGSSSA
jgi:hypothetical protein